MFKNRSLGSISNGFTLIELLVVIVIIGILATLATVSLNSSKMKSRDVKRVADVTTIQKALEQYTMDEGSYPDEITPGEALIGPTSGIRYIARVPNSPEPRSDGDCTGGNYSYSLNSATSYYLGFCLGDAVNDVVAGLNTVMPTGIFEGCFTSCVSGTCGADDGCGGACGCTAGANPLEVCSSNTCITDPYTVLMLHFNEEVGGYFIDYSNSSHTIGGYMTGNQTADTSVKQLGAASVSFTPSPSGYLTTVDSADWAFGSGDFTMEGWINTTKALTEKILEQNGALRAEVYSDKMKVTATAVAILTGTSVVNDGSWHHWAFVRNGTSFSLYVDGVEEASSTSSASLINSASALYLGSGDSGSYVYVGNMDELRFSKGIARWTANFTPSTVEY